MRPPLQGKGLRRLEPHLLPLQRPRRLLGRYRPQVDRQVHRCSGGHESLKEPRGQRPGPLAQVQGADEPVSDANVAAVDLHLDFFVPVELRRRSTQGGGHEEHPELPAPEGMDGQAGPRQHPAKVVDPSELAHRVETPVEDAVAGLQAGEQAVEGLGGGPRLRGKVGRLGPL